MLRFSASTALSKDVDSYRLIYRFMMIAGGLLTVLHGRRTALLCSRAGHPRRRRRSGARIGLQIMLPWTWSIGYRRSTRACYPVRPSRAVGAGTLVRLVANLTVLFIGLAVGTVPGIVVATLSVAAGVISEAAFIELRVRPVLRNDLPLAEPVQPPLTYGVFLAFYVPLVLTSLLSFLAQPIGSAALSRMPSAHLAGGLAGAERASFLAAERGAGIQRGRRGAARRAGAPRGLSGASRYILQPG